LIRNAEAAEPGIDFVASRSVCSQPMQTGRCRGFDVSNTERFFAKNTGVNLGCHRRATNEIKPL
jgi:hypothetical protein